MTFLKKRWQLKKMLTGRRCTRAHLRSLPTSPSSTVIGPHLPIWKEVERGGSLIKAWHSASLAPSCLYYSVLGKHLENKQWLSPIMHVALSKLEVLNKSQWTQHKLQLLIYMSDTHWMCKSIRKLTSWGSSGFHWISITLNWTMILMQICGNIHYKYALIWFWIHNYFAEHWF